MLQWQGYLADLGVTNDIIGPLELWEMHIERRLVNSEVSVLVDVVQTLEMRLTRANGSAWVFLEATRSGHIEPSSVKKQHVKAIAEATRILIEETQKRRTPRLRHSNSTRYAIPASLVGRRTWTPGR
jgi:hypothetical protein